MSDKELQKQVDAIKRFKRDVCASKANAKEFLTKVGIITKSGKLAKAYR
ncbi:MAG: hypothetical protein WC655_11030 [Candidatus Hydrogenedentales bacterium]|jgi:hypothetical protein